MDVEALFEQACRSVRQGNERRSSEIKENPDSIISQALLKKLARELTSNSDKSILNAIKLVDGYYKIKHGAK